MPTRSASRQRQFLVSSLLLVLDDRRQVIDFVGRPRDLRPQSNTILWLHELLIEIRDRLDQREDAFFELCLASHPACNGENTGLLELAPGA